MAIYAAVILPLSRPEASNDENQRNERLQN
jgi:hypothetical protein